MALEVAYGPLAGEGELPAVARILSHAFAGPLDGCATWLREAGLEHVRVLRGGGEGGAGARACLVRIPMGQHFGGRSVPMVGIAGVGVAPEHRGRGLARRIMEEAVREMAREGVALSALYASTQALYRQVGYEQAGHRFAIRIPLAPIGVRDRGMPVEPLGEADGPAIEACYRRFAARFDGTLDRGPYVWGRVRKNRDEVFTPFGVRGEGGRLDGYVFLAQRRKATGRHDVALSDVAFTTAAAGRRLLGFLSDFQTVGDEALLSGGPAHPLLTLMGQQRHALEFKDYWMLRVVDVRRALEGRGYAPALAAEVHLDVTDDLVESNAGRLVLRVRDGRGRVERGGEGLVRCDVRGLAAMYAGFMPPAALALAGLVEGDAQALDAAAVVFGGATPWMGDFF